MVLLDNTPSEQWRVSSPLSSSSIALATSSQAEIPVLMIREADWRRADTQVFFWMDSKICNLPTLASYCYWWIHNISKSDKALKLSNRIISISLSAGGALPSRNFIKRKEIGVLDLERPEHNLACTSLLVHIVSDPQNSGRSKQSRMLGRKDSS